MNSTFQMIVGDTGFQFSEKMKKNLRKSESARKKNLTEKKLKMIRNWKYRKDEEIGGNEKRYGTSSVDADAAAAAARISTLWGRFMQKRTFHTDSQNTHPPTPKHTHTLSLSLSLYLTHCQGTHVYFSHTLSRTFAAWSLCPCISTLSLSLSCSHSFMHAHKHTHTHAHTRTHTHAHTRTRAISSVLRVVRLFSQEHLFIWAFSLSGFDDVQTRFQKEKEWKKRFLVKRIKRKLWLENQMSRFCVRLNSPSHDFSSFVGFQF